MAGINTPMYYIGGKLSYTILHEEDGGLSSLNILRAGSQKVWFVISHKHRHEVEIRFNEYLCEKLQNNVCVQILKHKIYFITPLLLDKWNVSYTFVLQKPGDLFFIRRGTYHAVINLGKNIAEAVNYGSLEWVGDYEPPVCKCEENRKNDIKQDITVVVTKRHLKGDSFNVVKGVGMFLQHRENCNCTNAWFMAKCVDLNVPIAPKFFMKKCH